MSTLIQVRNSSGVVGRCDAKCYEAKHPDCNCICGGKNHGAGLKKAVENTREMAEQWIEDYAQRKGLKSWIADVKALDPVQFPLL